jgi:phosphatidylglycerophosphate synthase
LNILHTSFKKIPPPIESIHTEEFPVISIYELKPRFQNLLRPVAKGLVKLGLTANQVTVGTCLLSILVGAFLTHQREASLFLILPFFLFCRMALNAIDGMMAKEFNMKTPLGAILNELTDVIADSALFIPFYFYLFPVATGEILFGLFIFLAVLTEFTGVVTQAIGASRRYDGPLGKSDRAFVFGVISILIFFEVNLSAVIFPLFTVLNLLLMLTIYNRAQKGLRERA